MDVAMRLRLFAVAINVITLAAMPAAGAGLLGLASQPHSASVAISPDWVQPRLTTMTLFRYFRTTLANREAVQQPLLTNIAVAQANVQWDMPADLAFDTVRGGGAGPG